MHLLNFVLVGVLKQVRKFNISDNQLKQIVILILVYICSININSPLARIYLPLVSDRLILVNQTAEPSGNPSQTYIYILNVPGCNPASAKAAVLEIKSPANRSGA